MGRPWDGCSKARASALPGFHCSMRTCERLCIRIEGSARLQTLGHAHSGITSLSHEITVRAAILRSESRVLSRKVLANEAVAVSRRSLLAQSLVFSKGFFNSGTWAGLTSSQVGKVHAAGLQVYRIVAGQCSDGTSSVATDDAVIEELSAIAPAVMVRMSRMCLFVRVSARRPLALMRYLEVARAYRASWLEDVQKDFEWISMVSEDFVSWRGLSLRDHAVAAGSSAHKMKIKIAELCRCRAANACISWATTVSQRQLATSWLCPECRQQHKSKQALAVHRARRHGVKRTMRQYVDTTHCAVCLLEFHDRERLIAHLEDKSPTCRAAILMRFPLLDPQAVRELDAGAAARVRELAKQGKRRVHASLPCVRLPGPVLPVILLNDDECRHPLGQNRKWLS